MRSFHKFSFLNPAACTKLWDIRKNTIFLCTSLVKIVTKWYTFHRHFENRFQFQNCKNEKHFHNLNRFFRQNCALCTEPAGKMWSLRLLHSGAVSLILLYKKVSTKTAPVHPPAPSEEKEECLRIFGSCCSSIRAT